MAAENAGAKRGKKSSRTSKRLFDSSANSIQEGAIDGSEMPEASALELKRPRELAPAAFTCSFSDNPSSTAIWFGPQEGDARKSRTPSRSGRSRGVFRRTRFLRASPKPVSSLESCLRAQLRFHGEAEEKPVSRALIFQPFGGATAGLEQVESLTDEVEFEKRAALPPLVKSRRRRAAAAGGASGSQALLFSFGVGVGVSRALNSTTPEIDRLRSYVQQAEETIRALEMQIAAMESDKAKLTSSSSQVCVPSPELTEDQATELEAELEAQLELMQQHATAGSCHHETRSVSDLDAGELAEVVHDELTITGLPGVSDGEDDATESAHARGDVRSWAVSPRELDRRLRMLVQSRQEERICELEDQLRDTEHKLLSKEEELQLWKDRVRDMTRTGDKDSRQGAVISQVELPAREQSPSDDICDEFLRSVDEAEHELLLKVQAETRNLHTRLRAGANTPNRDVPFNTPRRSRAFGSSAVVQQRIKYWESLGNSKAAAAGAAVPSSCSDGNSSWEESSVSDAEEQQFGGGLIKRLVEKSRKGSSLLKDVQLMIAALDGD